MEPIIKVENLGKSYLIGHQRERYVALRDVLVNKTRQIASKTKNLISGGQLIAGNEIEEFWALKDINFEIQQGDRVGIIGRNGAGKSTLLKVLSRITEPTTGRIHMRGRVASLLEVGTGFHPELSGRENIYLNGAILGMSRAEVKKKFDEIVDFAGVEKFLDTPVKRYSSGMYVRLAFAVAAHLEPEILIVDEVLAVGDAEFQKKCLGKMEDVSKNNGRTVLFVSHNIAAIKSLCNKGIILKEGCVSLDSNIDEVVSHYLHSSSYSTYSFEWAKDFPRAEQTVLKKIQIVNEKREPINQISTNQDFYIQFEFQVLEEQIGGGFTVIFYDTEERIIFSSICNQVDSFYGKSLKRGDYIVSCEIPGNLLNDEIFNVSIALFSYKYNNFNLLKNILRIELIDSNDIRNDFSGKYGGILRPNLRWDYTSTF